MGLTAAELAGRMGAEELREHEVDHAVEPWGESRMDWRFGLLCSVIANCHKAKDARPFTPADFVPDYTGQARRDRTDGELQEALEAALGGG